MRVEIEKKNEKQPRKHHENPIFVERKRGKARDGEGKKFLISEA
jgi:hypothetical protein